MGHDQLADVADLGRVACTRHILRQQQEDDQLRRHLCYQYIRMISHICRRPFPTDQDLIRLSLLKIFYREEMTVLRSALAEQQIRKLRESAFRSSTIYSSQLNDIQV